MSKERFVTVENSTEHPFDFVDFGYGTLPVRVPPARLETPAGSQVAAKKNGSAQVPEMLLARCVREPVIQHWFKVRDCILVGVTMEQLLAIEIPADPKEATAASMAADQEELKRLRARNAELENAAKASASQAQPQPKKDPNQK